MVMVEWSDIPLLKTLMSIGFMPKYSNTAIPCMGLQDLHLEKGRLRRYLDRVDTKWLRRVTYIST
jgi:hypothetical protein